jgi:hypothetical protein
LGEQQHSVRQVDLTGGTNIGGNNTQAPILTVLIQTFKGEIADHSSRIREIINAEEPDVRVVGFELALGHFNMLVRLSGQADALIRANKKIASLEFIQNTASFVTYSEELIPNQIEGYEVTHEAKKETLEYLGRLQQKMSVNFEVVNNKLEQLLLLARSKVKSGGNKITQEDIADAITTLNSEETKSELSHRFRMIAAILGTFLIIPAILLALYLVFSGINRPYPTMLYMVALSSIGGVLLLMSIDPKRVKGKLPFWPGSK